MSIQSSISQERLDPRDAFPKPTHSEFDRGRSTTEIRPYRDPDTGRAPQEEFLATPQGLGGPELSAEKYHAFVGGIGSGKTAAGILRMVANAEQWNPGELGMIVTPTVPALKNVVLPEMRKMGLLESFEYHGKGSEEPGIHTPSGSRIILESADNARKIQRLRGPSISWFWMDEAAVIPQKAWDILTGRLRTGEYRNAFITTTPKGKNWVYDRFYEAGDVNDVFGVHSGMNPHTPDDYVADIMTEYDGQFLEQEVGGEFVAFKGLVHSWFSTDTHVKPPSEILEEITVLDSGVRRPSLDHVIYGVDWGHRNPAAVVVVGIDGEHRYILDEFYERQLTVEDLGQAVRGLQDQWMPGPIYADSAEPASIEKFRRMGLDAQTAEKSVTPGLQEVQAHASEITVSAGCQNVINEFQQYRYKNEDEGEEVVKANDHAMDALRYAFMGYAADFESGSGSGVGVVGGDLGL